MAARGASATRNADDRPTRAFLEGEGLTTASRTSEFSSQNMRAGTLPEASRVERQGAVEWVPWLGLNALAGRLTPESLRSAASAEAPSPTAAAFTTFNQGLTVGAIEGQAQPANVGAAISSVQGTQFGPPAGTLAGPMVGTVAGTVAPAPPSVPAGPATPAGGTPWYPGGWRAAYSTPSVSVGGAQYAGYAPPASTSGTHPTGFYGFAGQTLSHLRRPWMGGTMPPPSPAPQPASFAAPYAITPGAQTLQGMAAGYGTPGTLAASPTVQPGNVNYGVPLAPIGQAPATIDPRLALGGTAPANYGTPYAFGAN
ncbi:hypothetical protein BBJ28_00023141, partial [Nothophytophthora sp. Chile5]